MGEKVVRALVQAVVEHETKSESCPVSYLANITKLVRPWLCSACYNPGATQKEREG